MNENFTTEIQRHREFKAKGKSKKTKIISPFKFLLFILKTLCLCVSVVNLSCQSKKTDMRALVPANTAVYLETQNLGAMLNALTDNKSWASLAKEKTDFSALENIQAVIIVTNFESSEKQVAAESAVLNFKPHFVAVADTHQWKSTAVAIAENQIGKFARENYGADVNLERSEKADAKFFAWTSADGRKFFAAVTGGIIYAGNDETLIDECLAVKRGEAESLLKNENLARARDEAGGENLLAFGYVAPEGIAQIANFIGVSTAIEASAEDLPRSLIARILPEIVRKTTKEIIWTARKNDQSIEDKITIKIDAETASVFRETLQSKAPPQIPAEYLPERFDSITRYDVQNPQLAWRSVLLSAAKQTDAADGQLLLKFSGAFFESYGITADENFLNAIDVPALTARFDEDGEKAIVIMPVKDDSKLKQSITKEINFQNAPEKIGAASVWKSADDDLAAAFAENLLILGEKQSVLDCLNAKTSGRNFASTVQFQSSRQSSALSVSVVRDEEAAAKIIRLLGNLKEENKQYAAFYTTETSFKNDSIERRSISDFGLIGTILEKFADK